MKLKNKILLAASGLLILSGAAATTGTFAWFTANNTAEIKSTGLTVATNTAGLKLEVQDTSVTENSGYSKLTGTTDEKGKTYTFDTANNKLTDVSSNDGINFVKATIDTSIDNNGVSGSVNEKAELPYVMEFTLTFSTIPNDQRMAVYISSKSNFTKSTKTTGDKDISKGFRLAILDFQNKLVAYCAPSYDKKNQKADTVASDITANYLVGKDEKVVTTDKFIGSEYFTSTEDYYGGDEEAVAITKPGYLGTIDSEKNLVLKARIWLEGTDPVTINNNKDAITEGKFIFNGVALPAATANTSTSSDNTHQG